MTTVPSLKGDETREAIDALRGYVYQIYQSALAWIELGAEEFLFLEVAEDYAVVADNALNAVQVKETAHNVTINSSDIIASIDSFVGLRKNNPDLQVRLRHLTTSKIGKEKSEEHRIGNTPTLETWRTLAKTGDLEPLRKILDASKLSQQSKSFIRDLNDSEFREGFLKRIHFDCGVLSSTFLIRLLRSKLLRLVNERGGINSQVDGCLSNILITLLSKATQKTDRCVDRNDLEELLEKATQISVNRAQLEIQGQLINQALSTSTSQSANLVATRLSKPSPIDEVPFPSSIANRATPIEDILSSLTRYGVSWIFGASGVGKTTGAKIAARRLGGNWASINLRGLNAEQVNVMLSEAIARLTEQEIDGLLIDDLECQFEPYILDSILYLLAICDRADILLLFTSPKPPAPDFLFSASLPASIGKKLEEFSEQDIKEILAGLGVNSENWTKYIHLISGGGHPQLAIAAIQNMQNSDWDVDELRTLNSLLSGNTEIDQVRARTRERLLAELPEGARRLLERLSLKSGGFHRSFVLDMAQVTPSVPDGGLFFDRLIGSWVDQQERDRFALSPLLSDFAANTLTDKQKREINFEIANSLMKGRSLDPIEANSALLAARIGKNTKVILQLCMTVLNSDQNDLEMIAPHLMVLTLMRDDVFAYEEDPVISQMYRGAQLLLICQEEGREEKLQGVLNRFEAESSRVEDKAMSNLMAFLVYTKLLISTLKTGALPNFLDLIRKLDVILENQETLLPSELPGEIIGREIAGIPVIGSMFVNQMRQIKLIDELLHAFEALNSCEQTFRSELLKTCDSPDFSVDMLVSGAWLSEHDANTIDSATHSNVFAQLEEFAKSWEYTDLAVCCRKYQAIILDEYGNDKDQALAVLNEGLNLYGETNSELVRAKAKVLYRAEDHQGSLELSKTLIDGNAPLSKTEKAFLGRDAAISAEKQADYATARRYYLYGSKAAADCNISEMTAMQVGLMADAALASWHSGDRETCLRDFVTILVALKNIDPEDSLRATHCHAVCRHVLLWLDQDATGNKHLLDDGEEAKIFPGVVSNPEPHSDIGKRDMPPIEMAWYMLAAIENSCCLDLGISKGLETFLPKGPVLEGQILLTSSKMRKSLILLDTELFVTSLRETIAQSAYANEQGAQKNSFDFKNVTYGIFPIPTLEQQTTLSNSTEQLVLCFAIKCIFRESLTGIKQLVSGLGKDKQFKVRKEFMNSLQGLGPATDYNTYVAALLATHRSALDKKRALSPSQVFELAFHAIQIAHRTNSTYAMARPAFEWLNAKWTFIWDHQRFLLRSPAVYENSITQARNAKGDSWIDKIFNILEATLPTIGFQNESEYSRILNDLR